MKTDDIKRFVDLALAGDQEGLEAFEAALLNNHRQELKTFLAEASDEPNAFTRGAIEGASVYQNSIPLNDAGRFPLISLSTHKFEDGREIEIYSLCFDVPGGTSDA